MELTAVAQLRRMVLEHLSRYTWNNELPDHVYDILQEVREDTPRYRCCVYKERAVLKNRIDMALGQECSSNIIEAAKLTLNEPERTDLPIIDVLPAACDQCPIDAYYVTDMCRHCITHKCMNNCPKKAISIIQDRAFIDKTKCIECGRCKQMCPYGAIIEIHRPCVRACAIGAISIGENRKAVPVTKETAGATVTAGIGLAQLADVMPQVSAAMDKAQGHISSGDTVRIIFGIATIVVAGFIAWSQVRKHQKGMV